MMMELPWTTQLEEMTMKQPGANRALLTQDEDERAPDDSNIDDANANDNQEPPQARAGDGAEFKVWNGLWPGPEGRVAKYMTNQEAGSMQDQKDKTAQLYSFIVKPTAHLTVLGADTSPVAYLIHVADTSKLRVLYGLSPVVESSFMPSKPKAFRALMRDLEKDTDTTVPGMMRHGEKRTASLRYGPP